MNSAHPVARFVAAPLVAGILACVVPAPGRSADAPITWLGITIGAPASTLRATKGDPLHLTRNDETAVPNRVGDYWLGGVFHLLVLEVQGYVAGIGVYAEDSLSAPTGAVAADPWDAKLGQAIDEIAAQHPGAARRQAGDSILIELDDPATGSHVQYRFREIRLVSIRWSRPISLDPGRPELAALSEPAGDSFATAILDAQKNEDDGVRWEYMYLAAHRCDAKTAWKSKGQALANRERRVYDILHAVCATTGAQRDFYFDITPYFGK